jgi:hypothetical protein
MSSRPFIFHDQPTRPAAEAIREDAAACLNGFSPLRELVATLALSGQTSASTRLGAALLAVENELRALSPPAPPRPAAY